MITIILNTTHNCNLNCRYCYYQENLQPEKSIMDFKVLNKIFSSVAESRHDEFLFIIHGGEPLTLGLDYYDEYFSIQKKLLTKKRYQNVIQTNGTLINNAFIEYFKRINEVENGLGLGLSLDGIDKIHNLYRVDRGGNGSHIKVMSGIQLLQSNNIKFGVLSVLTDEYLTHLDQSYALYKSIKPSSIDLLPSHVIDSMAFLKSGNLFKIYQKLFFKWFNDKSSNFDIRIFSRIVLRMVSKLDYGTCIFEENCVKNCKYLSISPVGNVFPCDSVGYELLGNIMVQSLDSFLINRGKRKELTRRIDKQMEPCYYCKWFTVCKGGCPSDYDVTSGKNYFCYDLFEFYQYVYEILKENEFLISDEINLDKIGSMNNPILKNMLQNRLQKFEKNEASIINLMEVQNV